MPQRFEAQSDRSEYGDREALASWMAHLDATQRNTYAAYLDGRIQLLVQILRRLDEAKRDGSLQYDRDGRIVLGRTVAEGMAPTPVAELPMSASPLIGDQR